MKTLLMHPDRDVAPTRQIDAPSWDVVQDLALDTLCRAMAEEDGLIADVSRAALLEGGDIETIQYRQEILRDCLLTPAAVRALYQLGLDATDHRRQPYLGIIGRHPSGVLYGAVDMLTMLAGMLRRLRELAAEHGSRFTSRGLRTLLATLEHEISDDYMATVQEHLGRLRFKRGVLMSAELGHGNAGSNQRVREPAGGGNRWTTRLFGPRSPGYTFQLHERDEEGARYLSEVRDRALNPLANAAAQAADHVLSFFEALKRELAFYVGCLNLHRRLERLGAPVCFPQPMPTASGALRARGLYDVCLALSIAGPAVGNSLDADGAGLLLITGANQGGKSSFLRAIGLAQLMMQGGMFVGAESFTAAVAPRVFTHFRREEDPSMKRGKLEEELGRLSDIVERLAPGSLVLLNESLASTNEREGSELAGQVVSALLDSGVRVGFVTHLFQFAGAMARAGRPDVRCLRAGRRADGTRTFRIEPGEPEETSYGADLYRQVFAPAGDEPDA